MAVGYLLQRCIAKLYSCFIYTVEPYNHLGYDIAKMSV